jgi:hypothetical protein
MLSTTAGVNVLKRVLSTPNLLITLIIANL